MKILVKDHFPGSGLLVENSEVGPCFLVLTKTGAGYAIRNRCVFNPDLNVERHYMRLLLLVISHLLQRSDVDISGEGIG